MRPTDENPARIIGENIASTHHRLCRLFECALLHSEELTGQLLYPHPSDDNAQRTDVFAEDFGETHHTDMGDLHSLFLERRMENGDLPFSPLAEHRGSISMLYRTLGTAERLAFCRTLSGQPAIPQTIPSLVQELFGHTEPVDLEAAGKVAYQRNIFADEAFLHFSPHIQAPKAAYFGSFAGVCEQVYNGLCEYCILPLENSQDGKLLRFYGLIQKYELKIVLTCDVTASDKRHLTTFGLCKRSLQIPMPLLYGIRRNACFEFIFWQDSDDYPGLGDVLAAAQACSLRLIRADCLPRSDDEIMVGAGYPFNISLDIENGDLRTFLLFLALDAPFCLPLGIYHHL
ncbi:MAG: hypothetical protein IJW40_09175 [Clostridia bacterium]|nr:hypothetical protein [Clostridia bacterium]